MPLGTEGEGPTAGGTGLREQGRYAVRKLRRAPAYAVLTVGLLGLGLGIVAATFSVLNRVVLRPLPVADQERVIVAWMDHRVRGFDHYPITTGLFDALEGTAGPLFDRMAAVGSSGTSRRAVEVGPELSPVEWARVLGDLFGVLQVEPVLGRALQVTDDVPNPAEPVAVISHGLWIRAFGGSADVLGRVLRARQGSFTIVGVMPPDFDYPRGAEVWAPMRPEFPEWDSERPRLELDLVARLGAGASPEAAGQELARISHSTPDLAGIYRGTVPVVRSLEEHVLGDLSRTLTVLFLGGVLVLVVASLDLANLVLVRAVREQRELAVRRALGMDPRWVFSEAVVEAGVLGLLASGAGIFLGSVGVRLLVPLAPEELPRLSLVEGLDPWALVVTVLGAAVAVGVAVVLPRWHMAGADTGQELLRSGGVSSSRRRTLFRESVVAGQVAIAVWVLVSGALMVSTVRNLQSLDAGFEPGNLALVELSHVEGGLLAEPGEARSLAEATARIEGHGAVAGVTPVQMGPLPGAGAWQMVMSKEGQSDEEALEANAYVFMEFVEADFAEVLRVPVLRGRAFDERDRDEAPSALVVNQAAARLYWPGEEPVGQQVRVRLPGVEDRPFTVVGVVGDTRYGALTELKPTAYFDVRQAGVFRARHLLVRTNGPAAPVLDVAREALGAAAPMYEALGVSYVEERLDQPLARPRFAALLLSTLALTALVIAVAGVYSVMAFLVRTRRRELGVRIACGGTPGDVGRLVVRRALVLGATGSLVGSGLAVASGEAMRSLLFGVVPLDFGSLAGGVAIALASAVLASVLPAVRAAATDPAVVLREE